MKVGEAAALMGANATSSSAEMFDKQIKDYSIDSRSAGAGDLFFGLQGIVHHGERAVPTVALSYFRRIYNGSAPDLDLGSPSNAMLVLASADVKPGRPSRAGRLRSEM